MPEPCCGEVVAGEANPAGIGQSPRQALRAAGHRPCDLRPRAVTCDAQKCRSTCGVRRPSQPGRCARVASASAPRRVLLPSRRPVAPLRRSEEHNGAAGVVVVELAPHVLDIPLQRPVGAVDQRDHAFPRSGTTRPLAIPHMDFAEPPQFPLDVGQVQVPYFVGTQSDLGHQPGRGVVPCHRGELAARHQLLGPAGEKPVHIRGMRRDPQPGVLAALRPVHLIHRTGHHTSGHRMQLGRMPQFQEHRVRLQRSRPRMPRPARRAPQHPPEIGVTVPSGRCVQHGLLPQCSPNTTMAHR